MFSIIETRPDIAFAVLTAGSLDREITYKGDKNLDLTLIGFSNAD